MIKLRYLYIFSLILIGYKPVFGQVQSYLNFGNVHFMDSNSVDVEIVFDNKSGLDIAGWQFDISLKIDSFYGGSNQTHGWDQYTSHNTNDSSRILSFAFGPPYIPADSSVLINLVLSNPNNNIEVCLTDIVFSDQGGNSISVIAGPCLDITQQNSNIADIYKNNIRIFPNPVDEHLSIMSNGIDIKSISIWSLEGKIAINNEAYNNEAINLSHLNKGLYIVALRTIDKVYYENIIIR